MKDFVWEKTSHELGDVPGCQRAGAGYGVFLVVYPSAHRTGVWLWYFRGLDGHLEVSGDAPNEEQAKADVVEAFQKKVHELLLEHEKQILRLQSLIGVARLRETMTPAESSEARARRMWNDSAHHGPKNFAKEIDEACAEARAWTARVLEHAGNPTDPEERALALLIAMRQTPWLTGPIEEAERPTPDCLPAFEFSISPTTKPEPDPA